MRVFLCLFYFMIYFIPYQGYSQGAFQLGCRLGLGGSPFPLHATLQHDGTTYKSYAGTVLFTGVTAQYIIGDRIGMESGLNIVHNSYYYPEDSRLWRKRIWKGAAAIETVDYQIPILIVYRVQFPSNPFRDVTLTGGTSLDCFSTVFLLQTTPLRWMKNICGSIRLGHKKRNGHRLEYGIELQYAVERLSLQGVNYNQTDMVISSRLSMLTLNLYYVFLNRRSGIRVD